MNSTKNTCSIEKLINTAKKNLTTLDALTPLLIELNVPRDFLEIIKLDILIGNKKYESDVFMENNLPTPIFIEYCPHEYYMIQGQTHLENWIKKNDKGDLSKSIEYFNCAIGNQSKKFKNKISQPFFISENLSIEKNPPLNIISLIKELPNIYSISKIDQQEVENLIAGLCILAGDKVSAKKIIDRFLRDIRTFGYDEEDYSYCFDEIPKSWALPYCAVFNYFIEEIKPKSFNHKIYYKEMIDFCEIKGVSPKKYSENLETLLMDLANSVEDFRKKIHYYEESESQEAIYEIAECYLAMADDCLELDTDRKTQDIKRDYFLEKLFNYQDFFEKNKKGIDILNLNFSEREKEIPNFKNALNYYNKALYFAFQVTSSDNNLSGKTKYLIEILNERIAFCCIFLLSIKYKNKNKNSIFDIDYLNINYV